MADNVEITAGAGTPIATDDVGGIQYQKVKLVDGTADSAEPILGDSTNGLDVDVTRVQGTVTVSGIVTANTGLTQPLTDTELRASAISVDTGLTQPLTDTELRATEVPVSIATLPVDGDNSLGKAKMMVRNYDTGTYHDLAGVDLDPYYGMMALIPSLPVDGNGALGTVVLAGTNDETSEFKQIGTLNDGFVQDSLMVHVSNVPLQTALATDDYGVAAVTQVVVGDGGADNLLQYPSTAVITGNVGVQGLTTKVAVPVDTTNPDYRYQALISDETGRLHTKSRLVVNSSVSGEKDLVADDTTSRLLVDPGLQGTFSDGSSAVGIPIMGVKYSDSPDFDAADNSYLPLTVDGYGRLYTKSPIKILDSNDIERTVLDGSYNGESGRTRLVVELGGTIETAVVGTVYVRDGYYSSILRKNINANVNGNNTVIAATPSASIVVYGLEISTSGIVTATFQSNAGGTALAGPHYLNAYQQLILPYSPVGWFQTSTSHLLNLNLVGSSPSVGGFILYQVT